MELLQSTSFASAVASSKNNLKNISNIISRNLGKNKAESFLKACNELDFVTANTILDDTVKELTGYNSVNIALSMFADKLTKSYPYIKNKLSKEFSKVTSESDKVRVLGKNYYLFLKNMN